MDWLYLCLSNFLTDRGHLDPAGGGHPAHPQQGEHEPPLQESLSEIEICDIILDEVIKAYWDRIGVLRLQNHLQK